jgi:nitrogen regulatory protein PII-like uncharacterized protein
MVAFMRVAAPIIQNLRWNMTTLTDDGEMVYTITNDGFAENAVYHATCMTNYLLKRIKNDSEDYLTSENDILFQSFISTIKEQTNLYQIYLTE